MKNILTMTFLFFLWNPLSAQEIELSVTGAIQLGNPVPNLVKAGTLIIVEFPALSMKTGDREFR
jgi:hypothetical protein